MKKYDKAMRKFIDRFRSYTVFHEFSMNPDKGSWMVEHKKGGFEINDALRTTPKNHFKFRTGDIVLVRRSGHFKSRLVSMYTGTFSHVGMICMSDRTPMLFEANPTKKKVVMSSLDTLEGCYVVVLRSMFGIKDVADMKQQMVNYLDTPYEVSLWEFLKFVIPFKGLWWHKAPSKTQFCSELVINIINSIGDYDIPKVNWWHPGSFTRDNFLTIKLTEKGNY